MRNSASALRLMEKDVGIDKINVGNVSSGSGRKKYTKSVWLNEQDIAEYKALRDRGIELEIQYRPVRKGAEHGGYAQIILSIWVLFGRKGGNSFRK